VLQGDARSLPLPDSSVDLIVTSPPYFALRSYTDGGKHYDGQIGSEATPTEWLEAMLACTAEWARVLKPTGSMFVNLGDKYGGRGGGPQGTSGKRADRAQAQTYADRRASFGADKSLMGLPWRYAIGCIDQLGLILRAEIIWSKPNGLPESVTDRVRRSHEQWFHLTRQPRYFSAIDEIREPYDVGTASRYALGWKKRLVDGERRSTGYERGGNGSSDNGPTELNPLGKLPGSVWEIPSEPLTVPAELGVDHFAAFPTAWPKPLILGFSPSGICTECGEGRRPVAAAEFDTQGRTTNGPQSLDRRHESPGRGVRAVRTTSITGYACACAEPTAPTTPAVVLDPFGGTGTTALVAKALGRVGISVDLSHDYCRLAQWRTNDRAQLAKVLELPKPAPENDGQAAFNFDEAVL
jgi:DNA modification methylase